MCKKIELIAWHLKLIALDAFFIMRTSTPSEYLQYSKVKTIIKYDISSWNTCKISMVTARVRNIMIIIWIWQSLITHQNEIKFSLKYKKEKKTHIVSRIGKDYHFLPDYLQRKMVTIIKETIT